MQKKNLNKERGVILSIKCLAKLQQTLHRKDKKEFGKKQSKRKNDKKKFF